MAILLRIFVAAMIGGKTRKINKPAPLRSAVLVNRRVRGVAIDIEAFDREYETLAAKLHVLHLPDQLLDLRAGGLGLDPGQPRLLKVAFHRFAVDHGAILPSYRDPSRVVLFCKCS
jgi:hypothetical protein